MLLKVMKLKINGVTTVIDLDIFVLPTGSSTVIRLRLGGEVEAVLVVEKMDTGLIYLQVMALISLRIHLLLASPTSGLSSSDLEILRHIMAQLDTPTSSSTSFAQAGNVANFSNALHTLSPQP